MATAAIEELNINAFLEEIDALAGAEEEELHSSDKHCTKKEELHVIGNTMDNIGQPILLESPVIRPTSVAIPLSLNHLYPYCNPKECLENEYFDAQKPIEQMLDEYDFFTWQRGTTYQLQHCSLSEPLYDMVSKDFDGDFNSVEEVEIPIEMSSSVKSMSMLRKPGSMTDFSRGKIGNTPFLPGGLDPVEGPKLSLENEDHVRFTQLALSDDYDGRDLPTCAPGMSHGLTLEDIKSTVEEKEVTLTSISTNPPELLQPYAIASHDVERIQSIKRRLMEKESASAVQYDDNVTLNQLLEDDDDDEDVLDSEESDLEEEEVSHIDKESLPNSEATTDSLNQNVDSSTLKNNNDNGELDDELDETFFNEMDKVQSTPQVQSDEWAITTSVDVSNFNTLIPKLAIQYPFELDIFQKEAIVHMEKHECVFVAAHTSAGKTVVAEYAIAMAVNHMTRAIYTSPIKALSNQKYRDFRKKFGDDVGLITGDVSINPTASCLIMTTEILRSMLYRGADLVRDIEWVIFDEIHYINDSERGVVWEEVIIMLPKHVSMVFLSATTPNTYEFSDWIGRTKKKKIHVISTTKRPIPLQHYLYYDSELHKVMDHNAKFLPQGHAQAYKAMENSKKAMEISKNSNSTASNSKSNYGGRGAANKSSSGNRSSIGNRGQWIKLMKAMEKKCLLPVVVFVFSKNACGQCANSLSGQDFTSSSEKSEIHIFTKSSINHLQGSDQELPQVLTITEMLKRGIGVHHGGLLPIIKEMVEILFSRGLVKVLFATETFAMGVNMPARTVVFNSTRKHDGKDFRELLPGEYTQMAGRAGRRGIDSVGTVIIACWTTIPYLGPLQLMLAGKPTKLESQFRLTYCMILNLLRVEDMTVEDMIKRSFSEFRTQRVLSKHDVPKSIKKIEKQLHHLRENMDERVYGGDMPIHEYHLLLEQSREIRKVINNVILSRKYVSNVLCPGRIIVVHAKGLLHQLAVVVRVSHGNSQNHIMETDVQVTFTALVLCPPGYTPPKNIQNTETNKTFSNQLDEDRFFFGKKRNDDQKSLTVGSFGDVLNRRYAILQLDIPAINVVCSEKMSINARALLEEGSLSALSSVIEKLGRLSDTYPVPLYPPEIHPIKELKIADMDFFTQYEYSKKLKERIDKVKCQKCPELQEQLLKIAKISRIEKNLKSLEFRVSSESLSLFPDFLQRLHVLTTLGYIAEDKTVQLKGRVACEINTCDELILTEIIFENILTNLDPEEAVAVLSCLIFEGKTKDVPKLSTRLEQARTSVLQIAGSLAMIQLEAGLKVDPIEYCKTLNFDLMEVVYEWAKGMSFKDICGLTSIPEGSIVRCITRLDEVCREVRNVSSVIGDPRMFKKMEVASTMIKRDVIFATSLYLT